MKQVLNRNYGRAVGLAALTTTMALSGLAATAQDHQRPLTLEAGTVIPVTLNDALSSTDSNKGDSFTATVKNDDNMRAYGLPSGTVVEGHVKNVRAQQGKDPGVIALSFDRLRLPNESSYPITGSLIGLDNKSVKRLSNGRLVANSDHKNNNLLYTGYGAGAGLILGAITRGNTITDTLLGGGLGYLFGSLSHNHGDPKDVSLKAGTDMGVRLDRSVSFTTYDDNYNGNSNDNGRYHRTSRDQSNDNRDPYDDAVDQNQNRGSDHAHDSDPNDGDNRSYGVDLSHDPYDNINNVDNSRHIAVRVKDQDLNFRDSARPFVDNGTVLVPAIPVLRAENIRYNYTATKFWAEGPNQPLYANFGSRMATGSNNRHYHLAAPVQRKDGVIYVPLRFLAIVTGQHLKYDQDSQTVMIGSSE